VIILDKTQSVARMLEALGGEKSDGREKNNAANPRAEGRSHSRSANSDDDRLHGAQSLVGGACLMVTSPAGIPNEFDLMLDRDTITRYCRVAWRAADRMGVAFE